MIKEAIPLRDCVAGVPAIELVRAALEDVLPSPAARRRRRRPLCRILLAIDLRRHARRPHRAWCGQASGRRLDRSSAICGVWRRV
jgi:hypothetical protein